MTSFAEIRNKATLILDDEVRDVCLALIDEVADRSGRSNQGLWTIQVFSKWLALSPNDDALRKGVHWLATKRDARLLNMHFILYSGEDDEGGGWKIDDQDVSLALKSGFLVDPTSGQRIENFANLLVPYYEPAPGLGR